VPSFISVALHLREFFNALWLEYMLPSEIPADGEDANGGAGAGGGTTRTAPCALLVDKSKREVAMVRAVFEQRDEARRGRLMATGSTMLSAKCLKKAADMIGTLVQLDGCVDGLDRRQPALVGEEDAANAFDGLQERLLQLSEDPDNIAAPKYSMADLTRDMRSCADLVQDSACSDLLDRRMDRIVGKLVVPLFEAGCRGVEQSSVWGCMAAAVWARENKKKPYWPGIVLGIIAPEIQREDWHQALTERNEGRLPHQLQAGLSAGRKKAEQALRRNSTNAGEQMSYFLVEFMGTHEFAWVKEADMIDGFDPLDDPNEKALEEYTSTASKKKRSARQANNVPSNQVLFQQAVEECKWAQVEFERQVKDPCGDSYELSADQRVDFASLSSVEKADADETATDDNENGAVGGGDYDSDFEAEELFEREGLLDFSAAGRKKAKQKAAARAKKLKEEARKAKAKLAKAKKAKAQQAKKRKKEAVTALEISSSTSSKSGGAGRKKKNSLKISLAAPKATKDGALIPKTKRERAAFRVKEIMTQIARKSGRGISMITMNNNVESGLLAMALAFRSAAGEIPDPSGLPNSRMWESIDSDEPLKSSDRCDLLRKQIELIKVEISQLSASNERRSKLLAKARKDKEEAERRRKELFTKAKKTATKRKPRKKKQVKREEQSAPVAVEVEDVAQHMSEEEFQAAVEETGKTPRCDSDVDDASLEETQGESSQTDNDMDAARLMASLSQVNVPKVDQDNRDMDYD